MQFSNSFEKQIPKINDKTFKSCALDLFKYQARQNPVYSRYLEALGIDFKEVTEYEDIPFLPIEFYKNHAIKSGDWKEKLIFKSSGSTSENRSQHYVKNLVVYQQLARKGFEQYYGQLNGYIIAALLPSYLEQGDSSLIAMVKDFISQSNNTQSGFVKGVGEIELKLNVARKENKTLLLIGVSYALLDLEWTILGSKNLIVMETGGMKGRRKEMTKTELHNTLKEKFDVKCIHSEYGMTELLSQAYSKGEGVFHSPPWMKAVIRDINDPFVRLGFGKAGGINIVDLANIHTCAFIETRDIGKVYSDQGFEVLGRMDNSDIRGCNLLMA